MIPLPKKRPDLAAQRNQAQTQLPRHTIAPPEPGGNPYPRCALRGGRIIDRLPYGCPLAADRPLEELLHRRDAAWALFAPGPNQDVGRAVTADRAVSVCEACAGELLSDPHIRRLRSQSPPPNTAQGTKRTQPRREANEPEARPMVRAVRIRNRSAVRT